jgi:toxin CptA
MPGSQRFFKLRPSGSLALLFLFLGSVTLVSLWMMPLPKVVLPVMALAVLGWLVYRILLDANLRMGYSCVAFRLEEDEGIVLVLRDGRQLSGQVSGDSVVTPYLVILNVALGEQSSTRSLLIMADAMGAESFRLLRIALRWGERADQSAV